MLILRVIAAVLLLWAIYVGSFVLPTQSIASALIAVFLATAAVGLWLRKPWSQYLVYAISAGLIAFWFVQINALVAHGWPAQDRLRSFVELSIICVPLMFGVCSAVHVFRSFRRQS